MDWKDLKEVTISLAALYERYNGKLNQGTIEKTVSNGEEYYDLIEDNGRVCMDGETCEIVSEEGDQYVLSNPKGEQETTFKLTKEEMKVAVFQ